MHYVSETQPRFGAVDLTDCDREPIQFPGSIHPHGALARHIVHKLHDLGVLRRALSTDLGLRYAGGH